MSVNEIQSEIKARVGEKRRESAAIEQAAHEAGQLSSEIEGMNADLARMEKRHAAFAALGKKHLEVPNPFSGRHLGHIGVVELEPFRSVKSGEELAAETKLKIDHLRGEIARREAEIKRLLA